MMIDHLDIESKIIVAECNEAKLQVRKFGIPPPIGKSTRNQYKHHINVDFLRIFAVQYFLGESDEDDIAYREELFKEVTQLEKKDKITNQFHFIERATQTKNNDTTETEAQTDPPPMYSQEGF